MSARFRMRQLRRTASDLLDTNRELDVVVSDAAILRLLNGQMLAVAEAIDDGRPPLVDPEFILAVAREAMGTPIPCVIATDADEDERARLVVNAFDRVARVLVGRLTQLTAALTDRGVAFTNAASGAREIRPDMTIELMLAIDAAGIDAARLDGNILLRIAAAWASDPEADLAMEYRLDLARQGDMQTGNLIFANRKDER